MIGYTRRHFMRSLGWGAATFMLAPSLRLLHGKDDPISTQVPSLPAQQALLDLAATIEALSVTFYYQAITADSGFFSSLPTAYQRYLRLMLDAEWSHYRLLVDGQNATATQTNFYFKAQTFALSDFSTFLDEVARIEGAAIALYLAAIRQTGEADEPLLAAVMGQLAAIECEHRVMGREMAQNGPPAPNDLCFERADFQTAEEVTAALADLLQGGNGYEGPFALPSESDVESAVGSSQCEVVEEATASTCSDTIRQIIDTAAIAEGLGITFYYHGIQGAVFDQLSESQQWYLQAALDEEQNHLNFLLAQGAQAPPTNYYFPAGIFDELPAFLALLDTMENSFIATYLAAMQQFAALGQPLLAEIAGQIAGIESEHRVLGRVLAKERLPNNLCLARSAYACARDALADLQPFTTGNAALTEKKARPQGAAIVEAVDRFGCTFVPLASEAQPLRLPYVRKAALK